MKKYNTQSFEVILYENDIVETKVREDWNEPDTVETITEHALLIKKVIDGKQRGLLAVLPGFHMKKNLLEIYDQTEMGEIAVALLVNSFTAKILGNMVLRVKKTTSPARIFTDRAAAEAWLLKNIATQE